MMKKTFIALALLVTSSVAAHAEKQTINICTGGEGKPYHQTAEFISGFLKDSKSISVNVIETGGTWDNIERTVMTPDTPENVASGEVCHAFFAQPDGPVVLKRKNAAMASKLRKIGRGPVEYLQVICNKDSGVENLSALSGRNDVSVALGAGNSGAWLIWENFKAEDASYGEVVVTEDSGTSAISSVAEGETTCAVIPAALGSNDMLVADEDFGDSLVLVEATDKDFNDATDIEGKPLYAWYDIPSGTYPKNLQKDWFSSVETIAWESGIYVNKDAFHTNKRGLDDLIRAIAKAKPAIKNTFGSLE